MELTVIVPTRNEAETIEELVGRVDRSLARADVDYEVLVVDDSDDDTPGRVERARRGGTPLRLLHRPPEARSGGLAGAVQRGIDAAPTSDVIAVMDADLQHPPELLPALVEEVQAGADVAVASRYVAGGGGVTGLDGPARRLTSVAARIAARVLLPPARHVQDPMSGFFALRRDVVADTALRAEGFKILLEILVRGRWSRVAEVPLSMHARAAGRSKAGAREGAAYGKQLLRLVAVAVRARYRRLAAASSSP